MDKYVKPVSKKVQKKERLRALYVLKYIFEESHTPLDIDIDDCAYIKDLFNYLDTKFKNKDEQDVKEERHCAYPGKREDCNCCSSMNCETCCYKM